MLRVNCKHGVEYCTHTSMDKKNIIVIGASAGGMEVLKRLFASLPPEIEAAIFITWHMSADVIGMLPHVLKKENSLYVANAIDGEPIKLNRAYVAPPDHHMLIEKDVVRVVRGPKENRFRPAIDPLFRSAAYWCGPRVVGIVLTGALDDGTAGLWTIKQFGGTTIVQDPEDSAYPSMPRSALRSVEIDHKLRVTDMAPLLARLVKEEIADVTEPPLKEKAKVEKELNITLMQEVVEKNGVGLTTPYACPDCHGVLSMVRDGGIVRFRCHTGHAFSADTLLSMLSENIEYSVWNAIRGLEECIFLLNGLGDHYSAINQPKEAGMFFKKAKQMEATSRTLRQTVLKNEKLSKDGIMNGTG